MWCGSQGCDEECGHGPGEPELGAGDGFGRLVLSMYLHRYPDMPRPIIERGRGRTRLWVRSGIETWQPIGWKISWSG